MSVIDMTPELRNEYHSALKHVLDESVKILVSGGSSLDAVEHAVVLLEDSPLFNAGKGSVFASNGTNELDASIMDGATLNAGALAVVKRIKNPIKAARLIMEKSDHVLLMGEGAEEFSEKKNVEFVSPDYFHTERRWNLYLKGKEKEKSAEEKFGTVGAVAHDKDANLAAATSSGGTSNKCFGRVGDSSIIGAGTYADNATCAVSGTGTGEYFIRLSIAYHISALMAYNGMSVTEASDYVIHKKLAKLGGEGGVIVIDKDCNIALPFNSEGMYRGWINGNGQPEVRIFD